MAMMTKRHYETVAACIREQKIEAGRKFYREPSLSAARKGMLMIARAFALEAELDNPRFDRKRFMAACGFKPEEA